MGRPPNYTRILVVARDGASYDICEHYVFAALRPRSTTVRSR